MSSFHIVQPNEVDHKLEFIGNALQDCDGVSQSQEVLIFVLLMSSEKQTTKEGT